MKTFTHIFTTHVVMLTLFAGTALVFAEETTVTDTTLTTAERRAEFETTATDRQGQIQERREAAIEKKTQLQERTQERIMNLAANVSNRMEAAIKRIQNIIDRIDSRIEKMDSFGVDTTEAKAALDSAQISIDAAIAAIATIDEDVSAAIGSDDVRGGWLIVKDSYSNVRDHIKTAHTELQSSVAILKKLVADHEESNGVSDAVRHDI